MASAPVPRRRPRLLALAAALGSVLAALSLAAASPAWAHDELIGSDPAAGATVEALPAEIELTFSAIVLDEPGATEIVVTDAAASSLTSGEPVLDGTRVRQSLTGDAQGTITVLWRVVSSDGHPISGEYSFIAGDAGADPVAPIAPAPESTGAGGLWTVIWIIVGVVVLALGGALVAVLLAKSRRTRED
jgi:methionine-rich copper-binding protein CopC